MYIFFPAAFIWSSSLVEARTYRVNNKEARRQNNLVKAALVPQVLTGFEHTLLHLKRKCLP